MAGTPDDYSGLDPTDAPRSLQRYDRALIDPDPLAQLWRRRLGPARPVGLLAFVAFGLATGMPASRLVWPGVFAVIVGVVLLVGPRFRRRMDQERIAAGLPPRDPGNAPDRTEHLF